MHPGLERIDKSRICVRGRYTRTLGAIRGQLHACLSHAGHQRSKQCKNGYGGSVRTNQRNPLSTLTGLVDGFGRKDRPSADRRIHPTEKVPRSEPCSDSVIAEYSYCRERDELLPSSLALLQNSPLWGGAHFRDNSRYLMGETLDLALIVA